MSNKKLAMTCVLLIWLLFSLFSLAFAEKRDKAGKRPKLAVVVVVDQMRSDYLTRFAGVFSGGFKRLLDQGLVFTNANHDHATTETAVGHAVISTGCYPSHNGIVGNEWWDRAAKRWHYCVEDSASGIIGRPESAGRSPVSLQRPTLGDWQKHSSPASKVFAVATKDRAAILMGGHGPNGVFWYDNSDGHFVSSLYYSPVCPAWVDSFNNAQPVDIFDSAGVWSKSMPEEAYFLAREDAFPAEYDGIHTTFPHPLTPPAGTAKAKLFDELRYTPFMDELTLRFARGIVANEKLGTDNEVDLLWISCSAGDYVGHRYGPLSQEALDYYHRLDGYLGGFFSFLDSTVGVNQYVVALTGDHGVLPLPEELQRRGIPAGRIHSDTLAAAIKRVGTKVAADLGVKTNVVASGDWGIFLNYDEAEINGVEKARLRSIVAEQVRHLVFVADVYTAEELESGKDSARAYLEQYQKSYYQGRSPDLMLRFREFWIISNEPHGTTHGTCYSYDTHVPMIFWGASVRAGRMDQKVAPVDLSPTLGTLLGISPPEDVDGKSLVK